MVERTQTEFLTSQADLVEKARDASQLAAKRAQDAETRAVGLEGQTKTLRDLAEGALTQVVERQAQIETTVEQNVPEHEWNGTQLRLRNVDGAWGAFTDLLGPQGNAGWAPVIAVQEDGARRVLRVLDWIGGQGDKPTATGFVGATGLVGTAAEATDIRGPQGIQGIQGDPGPAGTTDYNELSNKPTLGTAAPLDVGTGANQIVQLDGSSRLPAVDGSQITNLPEAALVAIGSPAVIDTPVAAVSFVLPEGYTYFELVGRDINHNHSGSSNLQIEASSDEGSTYFSPTSLGALGSSGVKAGFRLSLINLRSPGGQMAAIGGLVISATASTPSIALGSARNAVRVSFSSGDIAGGEIALYGIKL